MEENPKEEVLIARDNGTGQVGAVVGQNPDGTPKMADVKSTPLSELIKFTKGQNPIEAFIANFMRQAKNPTTFGIFKMSAADYEALGQPMAEMLNDPETNREMLEKYRVKMKTPAAKIKPVDPDKVNWTEIEKQWGISREDLEKSGALQQMVYHHKSPELHKVNDPDGSGEKLDARLSFRTNPDGTYSLTPHFVKKEPLLDQPFRGYTFTTEDKVELSNTGNLGKAVDLKDPATGEVHKCLVSIDRLTNEIESIPVDKIFIKQKVANINLTMQHEDHLVDDHAYKGEFKRRSYADFLVKLYNVALDDEVVEWTFTNKPFDGRYLMDFNTIINADQENDLSGSFSFNKFIKGCFNARLNTFDEIPVRILVSSYQ